MLASADLKLVALMFTIHAPLNRRGSEHYQFRESLIAEIRQYWTFDASSPGSGLIDYPYGDSNRLGSDDV